jgi:CHAT domain-containing protein
LGQVADLEEAIQSYRQAVALTPANSPDLAMRLNNLGSGLRDRYTRLGQVADLEEAIQSYRQAVALTPAHSPDLAMYLSNLGNGLTDRYARLGQVTDLEEAIQSSRQAVARTPANSPDLASYLNNLGNGLRNRHDLLHQQEDLERGIASYREGAKLGLQTALGGTLLNVKHWLPWAFKRRAWQEVIEAYSYAYQASQRLIAALSSFADKEYWLRQTQGLMAKTAYAWVQLGETGEAIQVLEGGVARLLSEPVEEQQAEMEYDYQQVVNTWSQSQETPEVAGIIQLPVTLSPLTSSSKDTKGQPSAIATVAHQTPLVYLLATSAGGLALVVKGTQVTAIDLPKLTEKALQEQLNAYFLADEEHNWAKQKITDTGTWLQESIDNLTHWLWEAVMGELVTTLAHEPALTLIPIGYLHLLPLHAAWTEDPTRPTGRYYAIDKFLLTYAPHARSLQAATHRRDALQDTPASVLVVEEPTHPDAPPLAYAHYEVNTVLEYFPPARRHHLAYIDATRDAVLNSLPQYQVFHFAGHGRAVVDNPQQSGLLMAGKQDAWLTIADFATRQLTTLRLAILSACETGVINPKTPEEALSLAAVGLLHSGIAGIIASLWAVNDLSTAMLMGQFYENWQGQHLSPPEALRQAQIWLRDTTDEKKFALFNEIYQGQRNTPRLAKANAREFRKAVTFTNPAERKYAHPYYWAGFGYMGV